MVPSTLLAEDVSLLSPASFFSDRREGRARRRQKTNDRSEPAAFKRRMRGENAVLDLAETVEPSVAKRAGRVRERTRGSAGPV